MTVLQRLSVVSLAVGMIGAVFVVPWSLLTIRKTADLIKTREALLTPDPVPTPTAEEVAAAKAEAQARTAAKRAADEQAARIKAELDKLALPKPMPKPTPKPPQPAYSIVPVDAPMLIPLEGWVDQPNKDRPGRVHTNLMVRHVQPSARPRQAARVPCLVMVAKPAERIERPYGWVEVPARTIPVPCER